MTRDERKFGIRKVTVDHMEVGPAHRASLHRHADLASPR
jgi:hypothetical protein